MDSWLGLCHHSPNAWHFQQQCLWSTKYYQLHASSPSSQSTEQIKGCSSQCTSKGAGTKLPTWKMLFYGFNLKKDLLLCLVHPGSFNFIRWRCLFSLMLCSVTRMSFCKGLWSPHPTPFGVQLSPVASLQLSVYKVLLPSESSCTKSAEKSSVTYPSRQLHYGTAPSFKPLWKGAAYIVDGNVALLRYGKRNTESSKPTAAKL